MIDGPQDSFRTTPLVAALMWLALSGCGSTPDLVPSQGGGAVQTINQVKIGEAVPVGPKVASLLGNINCQLSKAARSEKVLPYYTIEGDAIRSVQQERLASHPKVDHASFTLANMFGEIEYVASVQLTLDVQDTGAFSPAVAVSKYLDPKGTLTPATSAVLSVGGGLQEAPHRFLQINETVDMGRFAPPWPADIAGDQPWPDGQVRKGKLKASLSHWNDYAVDKSCGSDSELSGDLKLEESIASAMIAFAMSDSALFPTVSSGKQNYGQVPLTGVNNIFGVFSTQIDFTIQKSVNGGVNWTMAYYTAPGAGKNPLLSYLHQTIDKLSITFTPVCFRWDTEKKNPRPHGNLAQGTPGWANALAECGGDLEVPDGVARDLRDAASSVNAAMSGNQINFLNSIVNQLNPR